jgi:putative membrane-bound dehydrogenase-like protein
LHEELRFIIYILMHFKTRFLGLAAVFFTQSLVTSADELGGKYSPFAGPCPSVEEARKLMTVPPGYQVENFAAEPMVVNPVAMSWDHRGRLWVVELYEYPLGAKKGNAYSRKAEDEKFRPVEATYAESPRDRVLILEDTDGNGKADKRTVFLEGLSLATGLLLGHGGAYVGQAPNLFFFRDTNGDDKADEYKSVLTGFGLEDRHELLNSLTWGPDGGMYFTHGVFTHSRVHRPGTAENTGVKLDAGIFRAELAVEAGAPVAVKAEVYSDGTSNPWGVDFDAAGNAFVEACVIDHLFHMAPGGLYSRQGGAPENPYAYELLPSIVNHKHFRAAYAGIQVYQGGAYPADTQGHLFFGNIHDNAIHEEAVEPVGATFRAKPVRDFLRANNGWFRPVSVQTGPDGCLWIMDWCDKYPCYQNAVANPAGVDREKGRIWRVVPEAGVPSPRIDLGKATVAELVGHLAAKNNWLQRRSSLVLRERFAAGKLSPASLGKPKAGNLPLSILQHQFGNAEAALALAKSADPAERAWGARFGKYDPADPATSVRAAIANYLRVQQATYLTVTGPPAATQADVLSDLAKLISASAKSEDATLPFLIWMALEPAVAQHPEAAIASFGRIAVEAQPLSRDLCVKLARRLCDTQKPENIDLLLPFLKTLTTHPELLCAGLSGILNGQEAKATKPAKVDPAPYFAAWRAHENKEVVSLGKRLATLWGDPQALEELANTAKNGTVNEGSRIEAIQTLRRQKDAVATAAIQQLLAENSLNENLQREVYLAASAMGLENTPTVLLERFAGFSPTLQATASQVLTSRPAWAGQLLDTVESGRVALAKIPTTTRRWFAQDAASDLQTRATKVLGRWNDTNQELKQVISAKRKACLEGEPDLELGKAMFVATCAVCHVFQGTGKNVGPDLNSNGRSSLDSLLNNIIDPNQVIGRGYENVTVTTKDGRTVAGRVTEDTPTHLKLVGINETTEVVAREAIAKREDSTNSLMPEGFGNLPDEMLRNIVWYILAPPAEGPLTKEKKAALSEPVTEETSTPASGKKSKKDETKVDWESISLWAPEWRISAPRFEGTPRKHPEYLGQKNVLQLHPYEEPTGRPAVIERIFEAPSASQVLKFRVASHNQGDWKLKVVINGKEVLQKDIGHGEPRWHDVSVPLKDFAGQPASVQLQSHPTGWSWEFSYWADLRVD